MKKKIYSVMILAGLALLSVNLQADEKDTVAKLRTFDVCVRQLVAYYELPGAAVAVVKNDSVIFMKGYGLRTVGTEDSIDTETVFRIASLSKGFASVLTGMLAEEGRLDWTDPVLNYLPDFKLQTDEHTRAVMIGHILSHSSGLMYHAYTNLIENNVPYTRILTELDDIPIVSEPGESYGYQNVIYALIGDIHKAVTDSTFKDLTAARIFHPLHMEHATIGFEDYLKNENRAAPHIRRNWEWTAVDDKESFYHVPPSAGINASIEDMAEWLRAMMGGRKDIIPKTVLDSVLTPRIRTPRETERIHWPNLKDTHYGYGWRIYDYGGYDLIYHGGGVQGYLAQIGFIQEEGIGIVVLMNSRRTDRIVPVFLDLFLGLETSDGGMGE